MASWLVFAAFALLYFQPVIAIPNCPIYGPEFPPPQRLSQHPKWQQAMTNLSAAFDYMNANVTGSQLSYSVQIFSTNPGGGVIAQRHWTASSLPPDTEGVKKVNGDTVYRIGSVSKIFAVLAFLAEVGDRDWNTPVTEFIPELALSSRQALTQPLDGTRRTEWDEITIGALASQVSGIGRDCKSSAADVKRDVGS